MLSNKYWLLTRGVINEGWELVMHRWVVSLVISHQLSVSVPCAHLTERCFNPAGDQTRPASDSMRLHSIKIQLMWWDRKHWSAARGWWREEKPRKQHLQMKKPVWFQCVSQLCSDEITMQVTSFPNACALSRSLSLTHTRTHTLFFFFCLSPHISLALVFFFFLSLSPHLPLSLSLFSTLSPFQFNLVCFYCHD